jgi:hypothetical protein
MPYNCLHAFHAAGLSRAGQTYFPVTAASPVESFIELAASYPVFELLPD